MRTVFVTAAAALALTATTTPADAAGAVVLVCEFADAACQAAGTHDGGVVLSGTVHAPLGLTCLVTDGITGTMRGAVNGSFAATRVGALSVWSVRGDIDGNGAGPVTVDPSCPARWRTAVVALAGA